MLSILFLLRSGNTIERLDKDKGIWYNGAVLNALCLTLLAVWPNNIQASSSRSGLLYLIVSIISKT